MSSARNVLVKALLDKGVPLQKSEVLVGDYLFYNHIDANDPKEVAIAIRSLKEYSKKDYFYGKCN